MGRRSGASTQALEALGRLPESWQTMERRLEILWHRHAPLFVLGQREQLLASYERALPLAETLGDPLWLVRLTTGMGNTLWFSAEYVQALPLSERALAIADDIGAQALRIAAGLDQGQIRRSLGDYRGAAAVLSRALALLVGDLARQRLNRAFHPAITVRSNLVACLIELGEFARAEPTAYEALAIAESLGHAAGVVVALGASAGPLIGQGRFADAIPHLERALALARQAGPFLESAAGGNLGHAYTMAGHVGDGLPLLEQAVERVQRANRPMETRMRMHLAGAYVVADRLDEAAAVTEATLALTRKRSERGMEAHCLRVRGEVAWRRDPAAVESAGADLRDALAIATDLGMRPLVAHCHLGLGTLYRRTGNRDQAQEHLTTATTMYREMEMGFWLEQAEAEMRELA
jgi:tetratricopeptide (TPR) repeat protein